MDLKEEPKHPGQDQSSEQSPKTTENSGQTEAAKNGEKDDSSPAQTVYIDGSDAASVAALAAGTTAQKRKLRASRRRRFRLIVLITEAVIALVLIAAGIAVSIYASNLKKPTDTESTPEVIASGEVDGSSDQSESEETVTEEPTETETVPAPTIEEEPIPAVVAEEEGLYLVALPGGDPDQAFLLYSSADDYLYPHSVTPDQDLTVKLYNFTGDDVAFTMVLEGLVKREEPEAETEESSEGETGENGSGENESGEGENGENPDAQPENGPESAPDEENGSENGPEEEPEPETVLVGGVARADEPGFFHLGSGYEGRVVPSLFFRGQGGASPEYHAAISTGEAFRLLTEEVYPLMKESAALQAKEIYGYQGEAGTGEGPVVERLVLSLSGSFEEYEELLCRLPYETDLLWSRNAPSMEDITSVAYVETYNGVSTEEQALGGHSDAYIVSATLDAGANSRVGLSQTVKFTLTGNTLEAYIPFLSTDYCLTNLVPSLDCRGAVSVTFEGEGKHEDGTLDMTKPVTAVLQDEIGQRRTYSVKVHRTPHNLPIVHLYTDNGTGIVTRDYYTAGTFSMEADHVGKRSQFLGQMAQEGLQGEV